MSDGPRHCRCCRILSHWSAARDLSHLVGEVTGQFNGGHAGSPLRAIARAGFAGRMGRTASARKSSTVIPRKRGAAIRTFRSEHELRRGGDAWDRPTATAAVGRSDRRSAGTVPRCLVVVRTPCSACITTGWMKRGRSPWARRAGECRPMPSVSLPTEPVGVDRCRRGVGTSSRTRGPSGKHPAPRPSCRRSRGPLVAPHSCQRLPRIARARPPPPSMVPTRPPGFRGRHTPCGFRSLGLRRFGLHPPAPAPRPAPTSYSAAVAGTGRSWCGTRRARGPTRGSVGVSLPSY